MPIGFPFLFYNILVFGLGVAVLLLSLLGEDLDLFSPKMKGYLVPFSVPFVVAYYLAMFATLYVRT